MGNMAQMAQMLGVDSEEEAMAMMQRQARGGKRSQARRYLEANAEAEGVVELNSGVQYKIVKKGDGWFKPSDHSTVEFAYATWGMSGWSERQQLLSMGKEGPAGKGKSKKAVDDDDDDDEDEDEAPKEPTEEGEGAEMSQQERMQQQMLMQQSMMPTVNDTMIDDYIWLKQNVGRGVPSLYSKLGAPVTDTIRNCLAGVQEAMVLMVEGDIFEVTMPSQSAFGKEGYQDDDGNTLISPNDAVVTRLELRVIHTERTSISKCAIDVDGSYSGCTRKEGDFVDKWIVKGKDAVKKEIKRIDGILIKNTGDNVDLGKVRWMEQRIWLLEKMLEKLRKGLVEDEM